MENSIQSIGVRSKRVNSLQDSEPLNHILFDGNSLPMWVIDENSLRFLKVNESVVKHYGYSREEFMQMSLHDIRPAEDIPKLDRLIFSSPERRNVGEWRHKKKDGTIINVVINTVPIMYGTIPARVVQILDITGLKKAENALFKENEKNLALLRNASDGIHILDSSGNLIEVSDSFCTMLGYGRDEMIGMNVTKWDANFTVSELPKAIQEQFARKGRSQFETRHKRKDGTIFDVEVSGKPLELDGKKVLFNSSRDISDRKQLETSLHRHLQFSQALNRISRTVVELEDSDAILNETVKTVGEVLGADRALIYDVSLSQHKAIGLSQWLNPQFKDIVSTKATYPLDTFKGGVAHMLHTRTCFTSHRDNINPALLEDGAGDRLHNQMMIQSLLWYPFSFRENGFYALVLNQTHLQKQWEKEEIGFLDSVSQLVSVELEKIRLMTELKHAMKDLRIAATAFESHEGILVTDADGVIMRVNRTFTTITGFTAEEVIGKNPRILGSGRHDANFYAAMWNRINEVGIWEGEIWNRRKNGDVYPEHLTITAVKDAEGKVTNYVSTLADITNKKATEEAIKKLAFFDPLTGLPNRRLLQDRLHQAMASSVRSGKLGALLFLDLDNFKDINDTLGHHNGDLLLQKVAERILSCVSEGDTVARLGGDEFVVMLEGLSEDPLAAAEQTESIGEKIIATLNQSYHILQQELHNTASIGISMFIDHHQRFEDLFRQADIALYQAKRAGRNTLRFFDSDMQESINTRAILEKYLRNAIENKQLRLFYQVQMDSSYRPLGAEALVRWMHPERGLVSPAEFIPLAEETGLILPIGKWVLETACAQLKNWENNDLTRELNLSVNVSAKQFLEPDFATQVRLAVQNSSINPALLKLELTESMLLTNIENIISTMNIIKDMGVRFSLDDFGTGYSSLQYLNRLPLHQLKIDQSFVRNLGKVDNNPAIVNTIIAMAVNLGMDVIAEGVETEAQLEFLALCGCQKFQGHLFSKPVPIEAFESLLKQG